MIVTPATKFYVVNKKSGEDGTLTFEGLFDAVRGGMKLHEYEFATEKQEAQMLQTKYQRIARMVEIMQNMTPEQAGRALDLVQDTEELMTLAEPYV